jgi:hypothetical protein
MDHYSIAPSVAGTSVSLTHPSTILLCHYSTYGYALSSVHLPRRIISIRDFTPTAFNGYVTLSAANNAVTSDGPHLIGQAESGGRTAGRVMTPLRAPAALLEA